jgi:DNA polymerase III subunit delta'
LYGHDAVRRRLAEAISAGRLPQSILLEGVKGLGKQRLALWLGQALLCEAPQKGLPCDACRACRLVTSLTHPDLHWFVPLEPPKKSADADKQVDLVEAALGEEMATRREQPFYAAPSGMAAHSVATVRLLLRRISVTPAMGQRKVFVLGDAERLTPQKGNPEAGNALLKALEEPPANTVIVLTAADPDSLLPTILSRVVRIRLSPLPDSVVTSFAQNELPEIKDRSRIVAAAGGAIGRVLALRGAPERGADESWLAPKQSGVDRYATALRQTPYQARGGFTDMLDGLLERLRREARVSENPSRLVEAIALVLEARDQAQGNVNPQLLTAVLADDLAGGGPRWS